MCVAREPIVEGLHVFMKHRVMGDRGLEVIELCGCWKFPVDQEVACFEEVAFFGELFDWVTSVSQYTSISVEVSDRAGGRPGIGVSLIDRDVPCFLKQFRNIDRPIVFGPNNHGHRKGFVANFKNCCFVGHGIAWDEGSWGAGKFGWSVASIDPKIKPVRREDFVPRRSC